MTQRCRLLMFAGSIVVFYLGLLPLLSENHPKQFFVEWIEAAPLPEPRAGYAAAAIEGKYLIAGGTYWEGSPGHWTKKRFTAATHAFDPMNGTWERLPDAPSPFGYAAYATVGKTLLVMGGYTGAAVNRKIYALEKKGNSYAWSEYGDMPADRVFASAVSIGPIVYLLGGTTEFEPYDSAGTCCTSKTATNSLLALDTSKPSKIWRQLPPYPGAVRWAFTAESDESAIWMFGGRFQAQSRDPTTVFNEVLRYDVKQRRWATRAPLPGDKSASYTTFRLDHKIILIGNSRNAWQLELAKDSYTEFSPLPKAVSVDKFLPVGNLIVGAGGESSTEGPRRRSQSTFIGKMTAK